MRAQQRVLQAAILVVVSLLTRHASSEDAPFVGKLKLEPEPPQPGWARELPALSEHDAQLLTVLPDPDRANPLRDLKGPISAIVIEGNREIATDEILKLIRTRAGQVVDPKQLREDIRALNATRRFFDVEPRIAPSKTGPGQVLVLRVAEAPILKKISFVGNKKFSDEELIAATGMWFSEIVETSESRKPVKGNRPALQTKSSAAPNDFASSLKEMETLQHDLETHQKDFDALLKEIEALQKELSVTELRTGALFDVAKNRDARDRIERYYHREGYAHAVVELVKGDSPDDREVIFKIDDGPQVFVTQIIFFGNVSVADAVLRSQLTTKFKDPWHAGALFRDNQQIERLYHNLGYLDVKVKPSASNDPQVCIEYVIDECLRNQVRSVVFEGNRVIAEDKLREDLRMRPNAPYDQRLVDADIEKVRAQYAALGRIDAWVKLETSSAAEPGVVDLFYKIYEDEPYPIGRTDSFSDEEILGEIDVTSRPAIARRPQKLDHSQVAARRIDIQADAKETPHLRDVDRLVFEGIKSVDEADIRLRLDGDFDVARTANLARPLSEFLETLKRQIADGFRHSGFPDVEVRPEVDDVRGQIVVRVCEGRRCRCGGVSIVGAKNLPVANLVQSLTEDPKSGRILWKTGAPAPCDGYTADRIRKRLEQQAAAMGFLSARFDVRIDCGDPNQDRAALVVHVIDEGLRAMVGRIEVSGLERDSTADVCKYLDLGPGVPFDSGLTDRLKRRLEESGRYLTADVQATASDSPVPDVPFEVRDLQIKLREYAESPKLLDDLAPAEKALIKLGNWLDRWGQGEIEEDLVMTGSIAAGLSESRPTKLELRMVVTPHRGQTIVVTAAGRDGRPALDLAFAAYPDRLVLAAPLRKAKLVVPNSGGDRLLFTVTGDSASGKSIDQVDRHFRLNVGMGINSRSGPQPNTFAAKAEFKPVFLVSMAHFDNPNCELRDGMWIIRNEMMELQIEAVSGRPVSLRFQYEAEGWSATIRPQRNALTSELQKLAGPLAEAAVAYDGASPWKALLEFSLDAGLDFAREHGTAENVASLSAARKLVARWSPPAFAALLDAWDRPFRNENEPFCIPTHLAGFDFDRVLQHGSLSRKNLVGGLALPMYRRLAPATGWLWAAGRDALLQWAADDETALSGLHETIESDETGPLGDLCLASVGPYLDLDLREKAGFAGIKRLTTEGFQRDYRPLLADDSWLGCWCLSLARAARSLDDAELRALCRLLPTQAPDDTALACLQRLKKDPAESFEQAVSASLDEFWTDTLRTEVSAELRRFMEDGFRKRFMSQRDNQVQPAAAEVEVVPAQAPEIAEPDDNPWGLKPGEPEPDPDENLDLEEIPELVP